MILRLFYSEGGYVKTKELGFADCYFFLCKKEFFNGYFDWKYGDSNHSATLKCLKENKKFLHLKDTYDIPNFELDSK